MKKALALVCMVSAVQGLISQEQPSQYKYLKQLPDDSRIKRMCYPVAESGRFWSRKNACDDLEYSLKKCEVFIDARTSYTGYNENHELVNFDNYNKNLRKLFLEKYSEMKKNDIGVCECMTYSRCDVILRDLSEIDSIDRKNECKLMKDFAGKLCKEKFDEFESDILTSKK